MRSVLSVLLLGVAVGCSDSVAPGSIDGKWMQNSLPPGSAFEMELVTNGSTVSGTGTWSGEACCFGTVGVTGTIDGGGAVHLDIAQTFQGGAGVTSLSHFDGRLFLHFLRGTINQIRDPANQTGTEVTYVRE